MWDPKEGFESTVLDNGLSVYVSKWPNRPWVAAQFLLHSGALQDAPGKEGTAHYLEHLVSENTSPGSEKMIEEFNDRGGSVSLGTTSWHWAKYSFFVPTEVLPWALGEFGPMLFNGRMERMIERERGVIVGEFNRTFDKDWLYDLSTQCIKALHHGTPFERAITPLGSLATIAALSGDDLQAYYDRHYNPSNMSIVMVGGLGLDEVVRLLNQGPFAQKKLGQRTPRPPVVSDVALPLERMVRFSPPGATVRTPARYETHALIPSAIDFHAVMIVRSMLKKKLFDEIRQKRAWAYAISPMTHVCYGTYQFEISCSGLESKTVDQVDQVVSECIDSLIGDSDAFGNVRRRLVLGARMQDSGSSETASDARGDLVEYGKIMTIAEHEAVVAAITQTDIDRVLGHLDSKRRLTVIEAA